MTHPLTPREKVEQAVRAASRGQWTDGVRVGSAKWCNGLTDAIITALASGSGDHAELAELRELREHRIAADLLVSSLKSDLAEAERKLAEAVGENEEVKDRLSFASQLLRDYVVLTGEGHDVSVLNSETRTFLSKEAERG